MNTIYTRKNPYTLGLDAPPESEPKEYKNKKTHRRFVNIQCQQCGATVQAKSHNKKFCSQCVRDRQRARTREANKWNPAKSMLNRIRARARNKGISCDLTMKDCENLSDCHYCGGPSTGYDRVDSNEGYTRGNVVPSCKVCNRMKWTLDQEDFIAQCQLIAARF